MLMTVRYTMSEQVLHKMRVARASLSNTYYTDRLFMMEAYERWPKP